MSASADRNLLFGILAVQLDFVSKDALVAGMHAWLLDKAKPLGDILRDQGHLTPERLQLLTALVAEHLRAARRRPATEPGGPIQCRRRCGSELAGIADPDVQRQPRPRRGRTPRSATRPTDLAAGRRRPPRTKSSARTPAAGCGEVFVAEDTELRRSVALKEIQAATPTTPTAGSRFVREAEITGGLEHPGIVPVYGLGTLRRRPAVLRHAVHQGRQPPRGDPAVSRGPRHARAAQRSRARQ